MEDAVIKHELSELDYTKVAALQQKRTLAFVNHFTVTTVNFLNNFISKCEDKLQKFERKLQKVEASLIILETKLSSVPELLPVTHEKANPPIDTKQADNAIAEEPILTDKTEDNVPPTGDKPDKMKAVYERFVKMVQVGVPIDAVKLKVKLEGLDPDGLDRYLQK